MCSHLHIKKGHGFNPTHRHSLESPNVSSCHISLFSRDQGTHKSLSTVHYAIEFRARSHFSQMPGLGLTDLQLCFPEPTADYRTHATIPTQNDQLYFAIL